jgi:hypothetical protein
MRNPHAIAALFAVICLSLKPALCQAGYGAKSGGGGGGGGGGNSTPAPPPVDHSASIAARKVVTEATAEVNNANQGVAAVVARLRPAFQQKPEWVAAQAELKADQSTFGMAKDAVLLKLQKDPAYLALKTARQTAETDRDALQKEPGATPEERNRVANAVFTATEALTKREGEALLADDGVQAGRTKVGEDNKKIAVLNAEFDALARQDAQWQAAMVIVDQKQQVVADARKALAAAVAQEAQAERDRQKQMAQGR